MSHWAHGIPFPPSEGLRCRAASPVAARHCQLPISAHAGSAALRTWGGQRISESEEPICSARGCTQPARVALKWNNPKIHTSERRKTWLACDDHKQSLIEFLSARGFMRETEPV